VSSDFTVFQERKREDSRYNNRRRIVWEKMKNLQGLLEPKLKQRDLALQGKVSQYWINYTKRDVDGIWLAYKDPRESAPYYEVCQLTCGIYKGGFFVGIEVNWKARSHLSNALNFISHNKEEFLSYVNHLNPGFVQTAYGECELGPDRISIGDIDHLLNALRTERDWFNLGEWYPKNENVLMGSDIISIIPNIFETLFPLFLVFAGRRPTGSRATDKLLRMADVENKDMAEAEKVLTSEVSRFKPEELNDLIADIDERNRAEGCKRGQSTRNRPYRRNPVLSLALKLKRNDRCQVCGGNSKLERGFFCDTHHVRPLKAGGTDTSDNILVLCPNHHRVFDRSEVEVVMRNRSRMIAKASGQTYDIAL